MSALERVSMPQIKRALLSVSDKTGLLDFAKGLHSLNVQLISTGGTAKLLRDNALPVTEVSDYTGSPEVLDGRLKTLHPKIHGGLLALRSNAEHMAALTKLGIETIDLVVVNLYPFEQTIASGRATLEEAIENIDIGGPTMLRAAAKNHQDVAVLVDPNDYPSVLSELKGLKGQLSERTTFKLAQKVFATTARYDAAIANYLTTYETKEQRSEFPKTMALVYELAQPLRYGENPHQRAAFYRSVQKVHEPSLVNAKQLQGKELSYNNLLDADATLDLLKDFSVPGFAAVIVKHANPCGVALSQESLLDAFQKAQSTDPVSSFGGIIGFNAELNAELATAIAESFFEVIVAPSFAPAALEILSKKKNLRLLNVSGLGQKAELSGQQLRSLSGGLLVQDRDVTLLSAKEGRVVSAREPSAAEWQALDFAWRVVKSVKSNAIVFSTEEFTLGIGAGQMSRVDSVKLAIRKWQDTGLKAQQSVVLGSDAFFPFRDGVEIAAQAGATAIIQPGGSLRDDEVIAAADEFGIAMVFTGQRHFRH